ncbi:staphylococcal nuclease domain-containing protein 1-like [Arapaima gigas]
MGEANNKDKRFCPLYDIPYMSEVREFLWKKFIGKKYGSKGSVVLSAFSASMSPTPSCGISLVDVASLRKLCGAACHQSIFRAIKNSEGMHSKKEVPIHKVADISRKTLKVKQFLLFQQWTPPL